MVKLTASVSKWLWDNHRELLPLIMLGHLEEFTDEMKEEYFAWCRTEEGRSYLKGGANHHEPR